MVAAGIIRYADSLGRTGRMLGVITFMDGKALKVWDSELAERCKAFAKYPLGDVTYTIRHSEKWGDSLQSISRDQADWQLVDAARAADEASGPIHRVTGYMHDMTKKNVQRQVEAIKASEAVK